MINEKIYVETTKTIHEAYENGLLSLSDIPSVEFKDVSIKELKEYFGISFTKEEFDPYAFYDDPSYTVIFTDDTLYVYLGNYSVCEVTVDEKELLIVDLLEKGVFGIKWKKSIRKK